MLRADNGGDFSDGSQAGHEDAVAADAGRLLLAELDQPTEAVEADDFFCQSRVIAQSGKK